MNNQTFQLKFISTIASVIFLFSLTACPGGGNPLPIDPNQCEDVACEIDCEFGFATGDDGCEVCSCRDEPICPAIGCADECSGERVLDENGCDTCGCIEEDPCMAFEIYECEEHDKCELSYDFLNDHEGETDCACTEEDSDDCDCMLTKPAPQCVTKDHKPEEFCNPYGAAEGDNQCPQGQHCEELMEGGGHTGGSEGDTPSPLAIPPGVCVDDMPQECDVFDEDSCPQGFVCEEVAQPDRPQEDPNNNDADEPHGGGISADPYPYGICVEQTIEPQEYCYSSDDCDERFICTVELGECNSPAADENGNADTVCVGKCIPREVEVQECYFFDEDSCPQGQHCEQTVTFDGDDTDPSPFPAQPVGICVDDELPHPHRCADLPIEVCEDTFECEVQAISVLCDCPQDAVDCQCPDIAELICVPAEPQPEEYCYSSQDCDSDRMVCTVELGECDSIGNLDVCVGKCIPRDMPQTCEETAAPICEQNPECELIATPDNCGCPEDEDVQCDCYNEPICVQREIPVDNDLCSTSVPCEGSQQCDFEVCTENENGEMGECFGHCVDTDPIGCIEVLQPAISPNGYCVVFPTPCEVPDNWEPVDSCE